jgi:hypothetical protein
VILLAQFECNFLYQINICHPNSQNSLYTNTSEAKFCSGYIQVSFWQWFRHSTNFNYTVPWFLIVWTTRKLRSLKSVGLTCQYIVRRFWITIWFYNTKLHTHCSNYCTRKITCTYWYWTPAQRMIEFQNSKEFYNVSELKTRRFLQLPIKIQNTIV